MGGCLQKIIQTKPQFHDEKEAKEAIPDQPDESIDFIDRKELTHFMINEQSVELIVNEWCRELSNVLVKIIVSYYQFELFYGYYLNHEVSPYAGCDILLGIFQSYELAEKAKKKYIKLEKGVNRHFCSMIQNKKDGALKEVVSINKTDIVVNHHHEIYAICSEGGGLGQLWRSIRCFCDKRVFELIKLKSKDPDYPRSGLSGYFIYEKLTVNKLRFRNKYNGNLALSKDIFHELVPILKTEETGFGTPLKFVHFD